MVTGKIRRIVFISIQISIIAFAPVFSQDKGPVVITEDEVRQIDELAVAYHERGFFNGSILVAQKGKIYYEKGFGFANIEWNIENTPDTKFELSSITKQFTAMAVMTLVEQQKIDIDNPISLYLDDYRKDIGKRITVRQLLNHTSGLPRSVTLPSEYRKDIIWTRKKMLSNINKLDLIYDPGSKFSYSNVGYNLLAFIVESVSGVDFVSFLNDHIFQPIGMNNSGFPGFLEVIPGKATGYARLSGKFEHVPENDASYVIGAGGLYSTVHDLFYWDKALYDHTLISPENTKLMFAHSNKANYGFGWSVYNYYISGDKRTMVTHEGGGSGSSTIIERWLDDQVLIVVLCNMRHSQVRSLSGRISSIIAGVPAKPPGYPIDDELQKILFKDGVKVAVEFYNKEKEKKLRSVPVSGSLNRIAYQYLSSGRVNEALRMFELYLAIYPTSSFAHDGYAEALLLSGRRDLAILNYRKALELDLSNTTAIHMLRKLGVYDTDRITCPVLRTIIDNSAETALELLRKAKSTEEFPEERFINTVGYNLVRNNRKGEAHKLFLFNAEAYPNSANTWDSLAESCQALGQKDLAIKYFKKSLQLNPNNKNAKKKLEQLMKK